MGGDIIMRELPKGLIVSCQALEGNPLRDSQILAHLAKARWGADLVSTTLSGYMPLKAFKPEEKYLPDFELIQSILADPRVTCPVIGEGRFWTPEALKKGLDMGLRDVVIGKAITNAMAITQYFVNGMKG